MSVIRSLLASKKFVVALAATVVAGAGLLGFDLSIEQVLALVIPLTGFVVSQGLGADHGKEAMKIAQEISNAAPPSLRPDLRLDALEQWVRENAPRLGAGPVSVGATADPAVSSKR